MAKLYAELSSDKGGRVASKGGDSNMSIKLTTNGIQTHYITYGEGNIQVNTYDTENVIIHKQLK